MYNTVSLLLIMQTINIIKSHKYIPNIEKWKGLITQGHTFNVLDFKKCEKFVKRIFRL